jgi:CMP-N,N'-diacetyllegionaminic acid synthase
MKVLCVIPARGGSKRLPGKNIMPILGKPIISYTIGHAKDSRLIDRIVCSTDDASIAEVAASEGVQVIGRPPEISGDTAPIDDALRHAVRSLEAENYRSDIVVLLIANVIYRRPGLVDECVRKLVDNPPLTAAVTCFQVNQRPEWMRRIEGGLLVEVTDCRYYRQQELPEYYLPDGAVFALRTDSLMRTQGVTGAYKYLGDRVGYVIQDRMLGVEIDQPDDILAAEVLLTTMRKRGL